MIYPSFLAKHVRALCLADCVDVAAVRRAVWEASPATLDVALKLHHEESP